MRFRRKPRRWNRFKEIGESNRLVALGACRAGADPHAEDPAVLTPLFAEVACRTDRALVDRCQPRRASRECWQGNRVTIAPCGLSACRTAKHASTGWGEPVTAHSAVERNAIVTH